MSQQIPSGPKKQPTRLNSDQLADIPQCPHCSVSNPLLVYVWRSDHPLSRGDGKAASRWAVYRCTSCGSLVTARGHAADNVGNPIVEAIFPPIWRPHEELPSAVARYLHQARNTLANPDASVLMSAAAIDAMRKHHKLTEGSLYGRIDKAVAEGILTAKMAQWAHRVRLDANNPRHADEAKPHMTDDEARRAFDFAEALGEFLYILPSRMPPESKQSPPI